MATTPQDRREADKAKAIPPKPATNPAIPPAKVLPDLKAGDQKPVPAVKAGDQNDVKAKSKKKDSTTVTLWKQYAKEKRYTSGTIQITDKGRADKPKSKNALVKFKVYTAGMSVADYIEASHKIGTPKATAQADVRWDVAKGLITVS